MLSLGCLYSAVPRTLHYPNVTRVSCGLTSSPVRVPGSITWGNQIAVRQSNTRPGSIGIASDLGPYRAVITWPSIPRVVTYPSRYNKTRQSPRRDDEVNAVTARAPGSGPRIVAVPPFGSVQMSKRIDAIKPLDGLFGYRCWIPRIHSPRGGILDGLLSEEFRVKVYTVEYVLMRVGS